MDPHALRNITVKEILDRYPDLLKLFMKLELLCPGCPAEAFHTVEDVAKEYGYDLKKLLHHINRVIEDKNATAFNPKEQTIKGEDP